MVRKRLSSMLALVGVLILGASACGGDAGTVEVALQEFAVAPSKASTGAGEVTFEATNNGPDDVHELVVIKTDLGITDLPTDENGAVDESGAGIEVIGEIAEFPPGETESATFNLSGGNYVLICNIWDEDEQEAHYQEGMRAAFTVEG